MVITLELMLMHRGGVCISMTRVCQLSMTGRGLAGGQWSMHRPTAPGLHEGVEFTCTRTPCSVPNNNNIPIWRRLRFNRRGASTPLWRVESCSLPGSWPNSLPVSSGHHTSMEHRLRRKHLCKNCDVDASSEIYLKEKK